MQGRGETHRIGLFPFDRNKAWYNTLIQTSEGRRKPMYQVTLEEAATRLPELVREASGGGEVVLTQNNHPVAKLIAVSQERPHARRGSAKGKILHIAEDFDVIPEGFEEYMP
jgi:prevent-host-death family protein